MLLFLIGFVLGALLTAAGIAAGALLWLYSESVSVEKEGNSDEQRPFIQPHLPRQLLEILSEDGELQIQEETCKWLNFLVAFVFSELRDSISVKRFVMKKISKEFEEVMFKKAEGRMIEQLTVRDYFLGTSLPVIKSAKLVKVESIPTDDPDIRDIEEIDVHLEVEYSGNFQISIDADLVFDKAAYVSFELSKLSGLARLRFTRKKETSWSFAFIKDPLMEVTVNSNFEGRQYPKLSSIIENQVRKFIKKKHTLPAAKTRYKPFFRKPKPQNQLLDMFCHDQKLTVGNLYVTLVDCDRLMQVSGAHSVFCTVAIGSQPVEPLMNLWKTQWPMHEFKVSKAAAEEAMGIFYKMATTGGDTEKTDLVIVSKIISPSAADRAGVKKGDILTRVNNVRVTSVKQARRLMKTFKNGGSVLLLVQRPPAHCADRLLRQSTSRGTVSPDGFFPEPLTTQEYDIITNGSGPAPSSTSSAGTLPTESQGAPASLTASMTALPHSSSSSSNIAASASAALTSSIATSTPSISLTHTQLTRERLRHRSRPLAASGDSQQARQSSLQVQRRYTPTFSSEEDRLSVSESQEMATSMRRKKNVDADTVSLYGVRGERGGRRNEEEEDEEEDDEEEEEEDEEGEVDGGNVSPRLRQRPPLHRSVTADESRAAQLQSSLFLPHPTNQEPDPLPRPASADDLTDGREGSGRTRRSSRRPEVGRIREGGGTQKPRDDHVVQKKSKEVRVCRNPVWNQKFKFNVEEPHHYLNICVWENLGDDRGNLLIGYVTISLMDIALECFHTTSARHMQKYVLVASSYDRATSSRTAVEATNSASGRFSKKNKLSSKLLDGELPFSGSILLKFRHCPKLMEDDGQKSQQGSSDAHDDRSSGRTAAGQDNPGEHIFESIELEGITTNCDICGKVIWTISKVIQCRKCRLKMHKKCKDYCKNKVRCRRRSTPERTNPSARVSEEPAGSISNSSSAHRELDQPDLEQEKTTPPDEVDLDQDEDHQKHHSNGDSFVMLEGSDIPDPDYHGLGVQEAGGSDEEWDELTCGSKEEVAWEGGRDGRSQGTSDDREKSDEMLSSFGRDEVDRDSSDVEMVTPYPMSDEEFGQPSLLWSGHLPPNQRESAVSKKVGDLQVEIDRIQELITYLYSAKHDANVTPASLKEINREIERYQEKMDPLRLLMKQLMTELNELTQTRSSD